MMNNTISINRIMRDFRSTKNTHLESNNIYTHLDENNIYIVYSLHIGDNNTPYSGGFYLFQWTFNNNYPFSPPTGKICTAGNYMRFHPNFYNERDNGRICLSILNTWAGPQWTSVHTLESILITVKSIMTEYPLQNEPGYETDQSILSTKYNTIIRYNNYYIAVYKVLKYTPEPFRVFLPIMENYFITHFKQYYDDLLSLQQYNNEIVRSSIYNLSEKLRYGQLLILFRELYDNLCDKHNIVSELYDPNNKKNKRKIYPILKACFRDVDHIHTYLDRKFIVYRDKRGYKRWRLVQ